MTTKPAKPRPTHVHGYRHDPDRSRFTVTARKVGLRPPTPVRYDDSDDRQAYAPKIGASYSFDADHVVAPTMPVGGPGWAPDHVKRTRCQFTLPPKLVAKLEAASKERDEKKSNIVAAALLAFL